MQWRYRDRCNYWSERVNIYCPTFLLETFLIISRDGLEGMKKKPHSFIRTWFLKMFKLSITRKKKIIMFFCLVSEGWRPAVPIQYAIARLHLIETRQQFKQPAANSPRHGLQQRIFSIYIFQLLLLKRGLNKYKKGISGQVCWIVYSP